MAGHGRTSWKAIHNAFIHASLIAFTKQGAQIARGFTSQVPKLDDECSRFISSETQLLSYSLSASTSKYNVQFY